MYKLLNTASHLGIPLELVSEYTDNDPEATEGLTRLLTHPFILKSLDKIREQRAVLYNQFVENMFESLYSFQNLNELKHMGDYHQKAKKLNKLVRGSFRRTRQSKLIVGNTLKKLEPYLDELKRADIGIIHHGSSYFGDSKTEGDADIIFYTNSTAPEKKELVTKVAKELNGDNKEGIDIRVGIFDLSALQQMFQLMSEGQELTRLDYMDHKSNIDLFSFTDPYTALIFCQNLVPTSGNLRGELEKTQELFKSAIEKDPILNLVAAYQVAINLDRRLKR